MRKRWILALVLVVASAVMGHAIYRSLCPKVATGHCTMQWLRTQLELSPAQYAKIEAIHCEREAEIKRVHGSCLCIESLKTHGRLCPCQQITQDLIDAVSAELTPEQRIKYQAMVAPCSHKSKGTKSR